MACNDPDQAASRRESTKHDDARGWRRFAPPGRHRGRLLIALLPLLAVLFWLATWERKPVRQATFSPDGRYLAVTTFRRGREAMQVWDVRHRRLKWSFGSRSLIDATAFSPDGGSLAAGRDDGVIDVWDLATQTRRQQISGNRVSVLSLGYSSDAKKLVSVWTNGEIKVFDISHTEAEELTTVKLTTVEAPESWKATISPDGRRAAITVQPGLIDSVTYWDLPPSPTANERVLPVTAYGLAFSRDSKRLALAVEDTVHIWSIEAERFLDEFEAPGTIFDVDFSPDDRLLAAAGRGGIAVWDLASGKRLWLAPAPEGRDFDDIAFAPDGRTLVAAATDQVKLYDVNTVQELAVLPPDRPFTWILAVWIAAFALWAMAWVHCGLQERRVWRALLDVVLIEGLIFAALIVRLATTGTIGPRLPVAASLGMLTGLFSLLITWAMLGRSRWQWRAPGLIAGWALLWAVLIVLCRALEFDREALWRVSVGAMGLLATLLFLMHLIQAQGWRFVPADGENAEPVLRPEPGRQFHLHDMLTWIFASAVFFGVFRCVPPHEQPALALWWQATVGAGLAVACATGIWVVFGHTRLVVRLAVLAIVPLLCGSSVELFRSFGVLDPWWWYATFEIAASLFVAGTLTTFLLHGLRLARSDTVPSNLPAGSQ